MSILLELSMTPLDKGESVGKYVSRVIDLIDQSGIDYRLGAMGTVIEGEWDDVMAVAKKCYESMRQESQRISISMKMDYRKGKAGRLRSKIDSVEKYLGRELKK